MTAPVATDSRLRRRIVVAVLAVMLVVAAGCAVWFAMEARALREGGSGGNLALADVEATRDVTAAVSANLKAVFSYDYTNLERTRRAVDLALTGELAAEYREKFTAASEQARRNKLVRVSIVRSIGVRHLSEDRATLLVFLDQQELRPSGRPKSTTATLDVTALRMDRSWRISAINTL